MNNFNFLKKEIEESFMSNENLKHSNTGDGRLDSAESEISVISHIQKLFNNTDVKVLCAPKARYWYDIKIIYNNKEYPINIKITSGNSADNVSSKEGLFYSLTGLNPDRTTGLTRWNTYNTLLTKNLNYSTDADYYFIIYFKQEEIFLFTSLKKLNKIVPNGNNLPFQCNWSENFIETTRSNKEQIDYLMETYFTSWVKKTSGFEPLMNWRIENGL